MSLASSLSLYLKTISSESSKSSSSTLPLTSLSNSNSISNNSGNIVARNESTLESGINNLSNAAIFGDISDDEDETIDETSGENFPSLILILF